MIYKKVKLEFEEAKDRFSRTLLVKEDTNLVILGAIFLVALGAKFEHNFEFIKNKIHYSPDVFMAEGLDDLIKEVAMKNYKLKDLGKKFKFLYDTGDYWMFDCKVYEKDIELKGNKLAYLVDGIGQGLWEDNKYSLMAYIEGILGSEVKQTDEERGYCLPWNFHNTKYSDFDNYDIEEASKLFDENLIESINDYLDGCHSYGFELKVKLLKETKKRRIKINNVFGEKIDVEDWIIEKTKTDLLSSLKNINLEVAKKYMDENGYKDYLEWKKDNLYIFEDSVKESMDDIFTISFFRRLLACENTSEIAAFADDVIANNVFLYKDNGVLKYYIPDELKAILKKELSKHNKNLN